VAHKREAARALEATTTLEHTVFHVGFFMDYWGLGPHGVPGVPSYLATRTPFVTWLDMAHGAAAIPGSGDVPVVFTHTADVARFVAASLDLPRWERETFVQGDRLTWNQFLRLAEEARGKYPYSCSPLCRCCYDLGVFDYFSFVVSPLVNADMRNG